MQNEVESWLSNVESSGVNSRKDYGWFLIGLSIFVKLDLQKFSVFGISRIRRSVDQKISKSTLPMS